MPWKVTRVSDQRLALVQAVRSLGMPVAQAAREFGVSRKTVYKWLERYGQEPNRPLEDYSRRPRTCPLKTEGDLERHVLRVRDRYGWGARKIRADLLQRGHPVPSIRTVHEILCRHGRVRHDPPEAPEPQRFERASPNELWQIDFKGFIEVQRRRFEQLTVLDDHSRYLLALQLCPNRTMNTAWSVLWDVFGQVGLPDAILCDNAFSARHASPRTISHFDSMLIRLKIRPIHGRPFHPQTQGKVERFHGTLEREFYPRARRGSITCFTNDARRWRDLYNHRRPHEGIGDAPPISRWRPSPRRRPDRLPEIEYQPDALVRKVSTVGDVRWKTLRIMAGRGLVGQYVAIEEHDHELLIRYGDHPVRRIHKDQLTPDKML